MTCVVGPRATKFSLVMEGRLVRDGARIVEASSSVSMVESGGRVVVVDTGSLADANRLREAFRGASIEPDQVDIVINTHLHLDHIGGNALFRNARFYAHRLESPPLGTARISEGFEIIPGVEVVTTPGHTAGSISVIVRAERRYAICGDAIPTKANLDGHVPPAINIDPRLALKSMDLLEASADVIVPGHGAPFDVERKR